MTNVRASLLLTKGGTSTGVFAVPIGTFVFLSVCWKEKPAAMGDAREIVAPIAVLDPVLSRVTNAVAGSLTFTERLRGRTAARSGGTGGPNGAQPPTRAKSNTCPLASLTLVPAWRHVPEGLMARAGIVLAVRPELAVAA